MATEDPTPVQTEFIEAEEVGTEFSDLGESIASSLASLTSSIREHVYENGRRYHSLSAGSYVLPNDDSEQERLDMMHHCISLILEGELQVVTLPKNVNRVLDCGTGTGIWAIDFADQHPDAQVIGVDLSPIQPSWIPPNCSFEVDDLTKPWLFKEPFDYIHSSGIQQGIRDWKSYTQQIFDALAPGGVVQLHEPEPIFHTDDASIPPDGYIARYQSCYNTSIAAAGITNPCPSLATHLTEAGFVDVKTVIKKMPIGAWAKSKKMKMIGRWGLAIMEPGVKSFGIGLFTRFLGMGTEEATKLCDDAFEEWCRRDVHTYFAQYFVEGRKPGVGEV